MTSGRCPESAGVSQCEKNYHYDTKNWRDLEREGTRLYLAASPRLSHKNFTRLSNASNLLGQSAKSSSAS